MSKINWSEALADYLKDETESYASIASKYGVSLQAVKKKAGKEGWQDFRRRSIQKVNQELPEMVGKSAAEINARQARLGKLLQYVALKAIKERNLKPDSLDQAVRSVVAGINLERKAAGLDKPQTQTAVNVGLLFNKKDVSW